MSNPSCNCLIAVLNIRAGILMVALFGAMQNGFSQSVTMTLDTNVITIGSPVGLHIHADRDIERGSGSFDWPAWNDTLPGGIEILQRSLLDTLAVSSEDGRDVIRVSQTLLITSWDSGFRAIPPVELVWSGDTLLSNPLLLEVLLTAPGEPGKIAAPADIRRVQWTWQERARQWLPWVLGILLAGAAAIWLGRRLAQRKPEASDHIEKKPEVPLEPAHVIALRELERIEKEAIWKEGRVKEHHASVSQVLRVYFEHRYAFKAMERSTDEIRNGLVHLPIRRVEQELAIEVLQITDLVKFAKWNPTTDDHHRIIDCCMRFVEQTAMETTPENSIG